VDRPARSGGAAATRPRYRDPRRLAPPTKGGARAKVVIEEFTDFECPFCSRAAQTLERVLAHYGPRVKLVFRHLPLSSIHPQAKMAAEAAVCAQAQGRFWAMQRILFRNRRNLTRADLLRYARRIGLDVPRFRRDLDRGACRKRVEADLAEARKRQIEGTPAFFINGVKYEGALPFARFKRLIDAELGS
jgi:protein-disulfide isomerase